MNTVKQDENKVLYPSLRVGKKSGKKWQIEVARGEVYASSGERCQGQHTFDPFRQLQMDPPHGDEREKAFFSTVNVQPGSSVQQWRRKVSHLSTGVSRSLRCSPLS